MTRPSRNQDQLLIDTAKRLLPKIGVSGMSLREVADASGVNLGMFNYYFGSKEKFVRKVLESITHEIFDEVEKKSLEGKTTLERLHSALFSLAISMRNHKEIFTSFIQDILNHDKDVSHFISTLLARQMEIIVPLLEAGQENGSIERFPLRQCLAFCMSSISMPTLAGEAFARANKKNSKMSALLDTELSTDESIHERVSMALKALSTRPRRVL